MREYLNSFTASFALHLALVASLLVALAPRAPAHRGPFDHVDVVSLPSLPSGQEAAPTADQSLDAGLEVAAETGSAIVDIPNFQYDITKIRRLSADLFPFLTDAAVLDPLREIAARASRLTYFSNDGTSGAARRSGKPPLEMSNAAIARLTDRIWSRRERWRVFEPIAKHLRAADLDRGQLPVLVRTYTEHNLLQPYFSLALADPRLWTTLGLAADHREFVEFITTFVKSNPSSKTTTELLFMLDQLAQGSRDSLLGLLAIDPNRDLWWTSRTNQDARAFITALQRHYRARLEQRGLAAPGAVSFFYDNLRLEILTAIVAATPNAYRASDARFMIGWIHWKNHDRGEAIGWWREMAPAPDDRYRGSALELIAVVGGGDVTTVDAGAVDRLLEQEERQWMAFWRARLSQFGYSLTSF